MPLGVGNEEKAWHWMRTEKRMFGGIKPIDMLDTDLGARLVEEMFVRIDEGMSA